MMIQDVKELEISKRRLCELQARVEHIVTHPKKGRRIKEMELAGVLGMIQQIQQEIRSYELIQIQESIHLLKDELQRIEPANLPKLVFRTLDVLEEVTNVLQPFSILESRT